MLGYDCISCPQDELCGEMHRKWLQKHAKACRCRASERQGEGERLDFLRETWSDTEQPKQSCSVVTHVSIVETASEARISCVGRWLGMEGDCKQRPQLRVCMNSILWFKLNPRMSATKGSNSKYSNLSRIGLL